MANPTFSVLLDENDITRPLTYQDAEFTVNGFWEGKPKQKNTDSYQEIPLTGIDTIDRIVVVFPSTETGNVRITIDNTPDPDIVQTLPAKKVFVYSPTEAQAALIKTVEIAVDAVNDIELDVRVFGA